MNSNFCATCPNRENGFCRVATGAAAPLRNSSTPRNQFRVVARGRVIGRHEPSDEVHVLCDGWAASCLTLADGRRQILAFLLPGDFLSPAGVVRDKTGIFGVALTEVQLSSFSRSAIRVGLGQNPRLGNILNECLSERLSEADRHLTAVAQQSAEERVAYLVVRLTNRLKERTVVRDDRYFFPLRQQDLADALGLTAVHVSRVMTGFRARGWMKLDGGILEIANRTELERLGRI